MLQAVNGKVFYLSCKSIWRRQILLGIIYDSAALGSPVAGTNFWAWGGEGRGQHPDDKWQPGDPFVGDPPQEPQGLNSVYDTDASTIAILKYHAEKMNSLTVLKSGSEIVK